MERRTSALWAGVLATALGAIGCEPATPPPGPGPAAPSTVAFRDITREAGLARTPQTYDAVVGDVDGDGRLDIYVGNHGERAALFRNGSDGTFEDVLPASGIDPDGDQHGTGLADIDNDGDLDLLVSLGAGRGLIEKRNRLYQNDGNGGFTDIGMTSGIADPNGRSRGAAVLDVDRDGWLDLILANHATPIRLFRNRGDSTFEDATERYGLTGGAVRVAWSDLDRDGFPDLLFGGGLRLFRNVSGTHLTDATNSSGLADTYMLANAMAFGDYDNDGNPDLYVGYGREFEEGVVDADGEVRFAFFAGTEAKGVDFAPTDGNTSAVRFELFHNGVRLDAGRIMCGSTRLPEGSPERCPADMADQLPPAEPDRPGFVLWRDDAWHLRWNGAGDHHLSGILRDAEQPEPIGLSEPTARGGSLWRGLGDGTFAAVHPPGLDHHANTQAVAWADVDNDGDLDLYIVDSGVDGAGGRNLLFINFGSRGFARMPTEAGASPSSGDGRGAAAHFFDHDGDGRLDLLLLNGWGAPPFDHGPYRLLRNESATGAWIELELEGRRSNRGGLGAWIEVEACGRTQRRYHDGALGPYSQSALGPHFGLGPCELVTRVTIDWPSGVQQTENDLSTGRRHTIVETP